MCEENAEIMQYVAWLKLFIVNKDGKLAQKKGENEANV
jgi:hypothetical protein